MATKLRKIEVLFEDKELDVFIAEVGVDEVTAIWEGQNYFKVDYGNLKGKIIYTKSIVGLNFWLEEVPDAQPETSGGPDTTDKVVDINEARKNKNKRKL